MAAARAGEPMALLTRQEHCAARQLWEEVFREDSRQFLDYYDRYVANHNLIFAEWEQNKIVSMVQLNPYEIHMRDQKADSYYIVAVATREDCRHQGRMRRLLTESLSYMYGKKIPFTFLMPASESIYVPFDFVTVYHQSLFTCGAEMAVETDCPWHCVPCRRDQLKELAAWSDIFLQKHSDVFTVRTEDYYHRIWKEQESMNGQILLFYEKEYLKGYCFSGYEGSAESWEIAVTENLKCGETGREEQERKCQAAANRRAAEALTCWFGEKKQLPVRICGFLPGSEIENIPARELSSRPMTMVRIVNLEAFVSKMRAKNSVQFVLRIKDPILSENCGVFRFELGKEHSVLIRMDRKEEPIPAGSKIPELTVSELAAALYGVERNEKIPQSDICLLNRVYLNELV